MEELQPFALNPLLDPTQASLIPPHLAWLATPQVLSHTLNSCPIYLDDANPVLLLTPPSTFTSLLTTTVDHTSPPTLADTLSPTPTTLLPSTPPPSLPFTLPPFVPFMPTPTVRCVGYRWVEKRLALGEEVLVIGRLVRERVGGERGEGGGGGEVMKGGGGGEGEGAELRVVRGGGESGERVVRESRESEWGMEVVAVLSALLGCASGLWYLTQRSRRLQRPLSVGAALVSG